MLITRKEEVEKPIKTRTGELIYEMIGPLLKLGGTGKYSLGYVVIPPNCSSQLHFHPKAEETYYILKGRAKMLVNGKKYLVRPGDAILINSTEQHQIFTEGEENIEFIVICAPPWEPNDIIFLDK